MVVEFIRFQEEDTDTWICRCGNTQMDEGFQLCDADGNDIKSWGDLKYLMLCKRCGRIIDQDTLEVVGRKKSHTNSVAEF